jgi:hypothetical protein
VKAVDFYKLPRAIQDRFVGSVMSGFPPAPILAAKGGTSIKLMWLGLSGGCFLGLIITARLGYGALDSGISLHSIRVLPLYMFFVFCFAHGLAEAFARVVRERALPYAAGVYLFPACLIDARDDQFRVYETKDLSSVSVHGSAVRVSFAGGAHFIFPLSKPETAGDIVKEVEAARDRAMRAHATEDTKELVAVDPLHNPRFSSPVGPRDAYELRRPPWGRLGPAVAAGVAVIIGPSLWALRNSGSDKKMYARATQSDTSTDYRLYMTNGDQFKPEVHDILLPRAELRDAIAVGTVDALLKYRQTHPNSKIAAEVQAATRRAMLAELDKAKTPGTLAALKDFAKRYPDHGVQPELNAAIHAIYMRELDAYRKKAPQKDKAAAAFIERLFAWAEKHGPKIEVRFRRKAATTLDRADQFILKTPQFMGVITYPSRFFDDKHAGPRETTLGRLLTSQISANLDSELFDISIGPLVTETDLPDPKEATLFVTHVAEWSGHNYTSTRPRGSYVGMNFDFDAAWVIPGDAKPYKFKAEIFRHAATYVLKEDEPMLAPGQAEEKVYETMGQEAFEKFGKQFLANFFTPPPPAK